MPGGIQVGEASFTLTALLASLAVGTALSLALSWHFNRFGTSFSNRGEFSQNFPLIVLTTTLIITVVKSSLALSLGLVGALSIVRFRTPIKEPEELAYLFIAISIGLGLGAAQILPTVVATAVILAVAAAVKWRGRAREGRGLYLSVQWENRDARERLVDRFREVLARHSGSADLRRLDQLKDSVQALFFVDFDRPEGIGALMDELRRDFPGIEVSLIDQSRIQSV